jgi:hypothetical protein
VAGQYNVAGPLRGSEIAKYRERRVR